MGLGYLRDSHEDARCLQAFEERRLQEQWSRFQKNAPFLTEAEEAACKYLQKFFNDLDNTILEYAFLHSAESRQNSAAKKDHNKQWIALNIGWKRGTASYREPVTIEMHTLGDGSIKVCVPSGSMELSTGRYIKTDDVETVQIMRDILLYPYGAKSNNEKTRSEAMLNTNIGALINKSPEIRIVRDKTKVISEAQAITPGMS